MIQDDMIPCRNFAAALEGIARSNPNVPVCLFVSGQPSAFKGGMLRAAKQGKTYIDLRYCPFMPICAVLWPKHKAVEFLEWATERTRNSTREWRADDAMLADWMSATRQAFRASVPSLAEHMGVPSTKGSSNVESWRATVLAEDAADYAW